MSRPRRLFAALSILLPAASGLLATMPYTASAATTVTAPTPLMSAPAEESGVLVALEPGVELSIDGAPEGMYYPVTADGISGWIDGSAMRVEKSASDAAPDAAPAEPDAIGGDSTPAAVDASSQEITVVSDAPSTSDDASGASGTETELPPPAAEEASQPVAVEPPPAESTLDADSPPTANAAGTETLPESPSSPAAEPAADTEATAATSDEAAATLPDAAPANPDPKQPEMRRNGPTTLLMDAPLLESPDPNSGLVFLVPAGSTFNLYGDEKNGYLYGEFMWMFGWIRSDQLDAAERVRDERVDPEAEPVDTRTPKPGAGMAWTTVDLTLRAGPSAAEDSMGVVPAGTRVELTGVMQNEFQRVVYNDEVGWLSNAYLELPKDPEPEVGANGRPEWTEREIIKIIEQAADRYGQSREDMLRVARCESNLDPYSVNPSGSYGLFQFVRSTWESTPFADKDIFDPEANANAAGWMWQQGRRSEWVCQ